MEHLQSFYYYLQSANFHKITLHQTKQKPLLKNSFKNISNWTTATVKRKKNIFSHKLRTDSK